MKSIHLALGWAMLCLAVESVAAESGQTTGPDQVPEGLTTAMSTDIRQPADAAGGDIPERLQGEPWRQITAQVTADRHRIQYRSGHWQADTPRQQYSTHFGPHGPLLGVRHGEREHRIGFALTAADVDGRGLELDTARRVAEGNRLEYRRGALTEWYVNRTGGLEQGFTVNRAPEGSTLRINMHLDTVLPGRIAGNALLLSDNGHDIFRYASLKAWDADGRVLPAAMTLDDNRLALVVQVENARYPVTVDPVMFNETAKLTAGDGAVGDEFGFKVSLSVDRALISAWLDDDNGTDSGSTYIFDFDGTNWNQSAKLTPNDGAAGDQFGVSVSLSGHRALVGAWHDDDNGTDSGSAYVFDFDGANWNQSAKLTADDGAARDEFGARVSLSGDRALVAARLDDDNGFDSGSAYVFDFDGTNWSQSAKLTSGDGAAGDQFGIRISLSGDRALIAAWLDDDNGTDSGSAYVFDFDGTSWAQSAKLTATDGAAGDFFGLSVTLAGDRALVGASHDDDNGTDSGSAYVFDFDGTNWSQSAKLTPTDGAAGDFFGDSGSLSGDRALVGAVLDDDNGTDSGSAYVFDFDGANWSQSAKLTAADGTGNERFGGEVCLTGDRMMIGAARLDTDMGTDSGSVYVFDVATFTIGGTVSGLAGSGLVLQNNGGDDLAINADGPFTFPAALPDGSSYSVSVLTQPGSPSQTCTVANGSGTLAGADVTDVAVNCVTDTFTIGGTVSGLAGSGLVLQNNGSDDLPINADGIFTFPTALDDGSSYSVTVLAQPGSPSQTCTVTNGSGTLAGADVTDVAVNCITDTFTIGGTVSGLQGTGLVLQNNGGDDLAIAADGIFTFPTALDDGSSYSVSVLTQPGSPSQTCSVTNGAGTLAGADVTDVAVTCVTDTFTIGGTVSGLAGSGLVLQNNGGDDLAINADGIFTFPTALDDGSNYTVTVASQPASPNQVCSVTNGSGTLGGADVTDVQIDCVAAFTVGGSVSGLKLPGLVLGLNGNSMLLFDTDSPFMFPDALPDGAGYLVEIPMVPDAHDCVVVNESGTITGADVNNVQVSCATDIEFADSFESLKPVPVEL